MSSPDQSKKNKVVSRTEASPAPSQFGAHEDPFWTAAHQAAAALKALASWRLVEAKSDAASEADPLWTSVKNIASWRAPEPKREVKAPAPDCEPAYKVDLLMSALTRKVDKRGTK